MTENFLTGDDSYPSFKFTDIGDKAAGIVLSTEKRDDYVFGTREVKTWPNGEKQYLHLFLLETESGIWKLWVKGQMKTAIMEAAAKAKVKEMPGVFLEVEYLGLGEPKKPGYAAPKRYKAQVKPAQMSTVSVDDLLG